MATKQFVTPSHVTQVSSNFTKNYTTGYYSGTATFAADAGYKFGGNISTSASVPTGYYVVVTRQNGTTFNIGTSQYCSFALNANSQLVFTLKAAAQLTEELFTPLTYTLNAILEQTAKVITISQNTTNCNNNAPSEITTDDTVLSITATATNGYQFNTAPTLQFFDANNNVLHSFTFTVASDYLSASVNVDLTQLADFADVETIILTAAAAVIPQIKTVAITQNCTNCVTNAPSNVREDSGVINIIATPSNGYQFDTAPTLQFLDANNNVLHSFTFTVLSSRLSANVTFDVSQFADFADVETIILTAAAAVIPQIIYVDTDNQNCNVDGMPQTVYTNSVLTITATAINGYRFNVTPYIYGVDANGYPILVNFSTVDRLTAALVLNFADYRLDGGERFTIYATADAIQPYIEKYGTINVYKVTTNDLALFAAQRFFKEKDNPSDTTGYFQLIDLGAYVVSVRRFYCNVSDTSNAVMKCGNYNTNISVQTPNNDNLTVNCGSVTIPFYNNSIVDYQAEINVFVPFVGYVNLSSDFVGKTIYLEYNVNLVVGDCVAKIICDEKVIQFIECTISNDIIYKTNNPNEYGGKADFNLQVLKGLQPYIIVKYFDDLTSQKYNNDNERVILRNLYGFARIIELSNFDSTNVSRETFEQIENVLSEGVIF